MGQSRLLFTGYTANSNLEQSLSEEETKCDDKLHNKDIYEDERIFEYEHHHEVMPVDSVILLPRNYVEDVRFGFLFEENRTIVSIEFARARGDENDNIWWLRNKATCNDIDLYYVKTLL